MQHAIAAARQPVRYLGERCARTRFLKTAAATTVLTAAPSL